MTDEEEEIRYIAEQENISSIEQNTSFPSISSSWSNDKNHTPIEEQSLLSRAVPSVRVDFRNDSTLQQRKQGQASAASAHLFSNNNPVNEEHFWMAEKPAKVYYKQPDSGVRWCGKWESWQCMVCVIGCTCLTGVIGLSLAVLLALDASE